MSGCKRRSIAAISPIGTGILLLAWWLVALVMSSRLTPSQLLKPLPALVAHLRGRRQGARRTRSSSTTARSDARSTAQPAQELTTEAAREPKRPRTQPAAQPRVLGAAVGCLDIGAPSGPLYRTAPVPQVAWELPKIEEILEPGGDSSLSEDDLRIKANIIEETLHHLGVEGKVVEVNRGPAITQFGVEPGFITARDGKQTKVKVSRITALADDLALALAARTIRIEAPVPGRNIVGIEVPNAETALVALRDVMESDNFAKVGKKSKLAIALGQDVSGQPVSADLAAMPHLLIAGTTGSGKSVCVNAIITCLLTRNTPDDLQLMMVDPKRVELTTLQRHPAPDGAGGRGPGARGRRAALGDARDGRRATTSLPRPARATLTTTTLASSRAKDVPEGEERLEKLPYIVVLIDELADLMMLAPGRDRADDLPPGADGARHRHSPDPRHAAPVGGCGDGSDQGQLSRRAFRSRSPRRWTAA